MIALESSVKKLARHIDSHTALCSRNADYYEKISDPLDLSTIEKQILIGHYKTVEAFDADMLKVFRNAEVFANFKHKFKKSGLKRTILELLSFLLGKTVTFF